MPNKLSILWQANAVHMVTLDRARTATRRARVCWWCARLSVNAGVEGRSTRRYAERARAWGARARAACPRHWRALNNLIGAWHHALHARFECRRCAALRRTQPRRGDAPLTFA